MLLEAGLGVILRGFISKEGPDLGTGLVRPSTFNTVEGPEGSTGLGAESEGCSVFIGGGLAQGERESRERGPILGGRFSSF